MNERNLNEGQWEDRKQWSLSVGQRRKRFEPDIYIQQKLTRTSVLHKFNTPFSPLPDFTSRYVLIQQITV